MMTFTLQRQTLRKTWEVIAYSGIESRMVNLMNESADPVGRALRVRPMPKASAQLLYNNR